MNKFLIIFFGGGLGAVFRYILSGYVQNKAITLFPVGTLIVNLTGSFLIGLIGGIMEYRIIPVPFRYFFLIGFLGAFTTFSTYMFETFNLIHTSDYIDAAVYFISHNFFAIILVFLGFLVSSFIFNV